MFAQQPLTQRRGSVMLLSVLIMGAILLSVAIAGFDALFYERRANAVYEQQAQALALATGCMEYAMQRLGQSASYGGNQTYPIDGEICTILPIEVSSVWTIKTQVTMQQRTARIRVVLSSRSPVTISVWEEGAVF
mgnify:CR=1 FL=1